MSALPARRDRTEDLRRQLGDLAWRRDGRTVDRRGQLPVSLRIVRLLPACGRAVIDSNAIMSNILVIRGHRVLLDSDLAALYQLSSSPSSHSIGAPQSGRGFKRSLIECVDGPLGRVRSRWSHPSVIDPEVPLAGGCSRALN
jgi:hypothetical protein